MARKPNLAVQSTCIICGCAFHPHRGRETLQRVCSHRCASVLGTRALQAKRVEQTTQRATKRQTGKQHRTGRQRNAVSAVPGARQAASSLRSSAETFVTAPNEAQAPTADICARDQDTAMAGQEWLASAIRFERLTAELTKRERGSRTLILAGHGANIRVERDALVVTEGHTHNPQTPLTHTLFRGMHDVDRIICLNPSGSLSFPAVQWCTEQDITVTLLDRSGGVLATLTPEAKVDVLLRRQQYLAASTGQDVVIARELVRRKLERQQQTLHAHPELPGAARAIEVLEQALSWLMLPTPPPWLESLSMVRTYEGRAASAYFAAWVGLPLRWAKLDAKRVPPHWLAVRARNSPLSHNGMSRHAVDPTNALLNYAYAVLESQARAALSSLGFDLACGFLHAHTDRRDSLVYDLMECERGTVDGLVLDFLKTTTFLKGVFTLVSDGSCRLHPQLTRAVVAACRVPQEQIDCRAEWLRSQLIRGTVRASTRDERQAEQIAANLCSATLSCDR